MLGYKLELSGNTPTSYNNVIIEDSDENKHVFDQYGRTVKILCKSEAVDKGTKTVNNTQADAIEIQYDSNYYTCLNLGTIYDGAGRKYKFELNNSKYTRLDYYGTGETIISSVNYTYTDDGQQSEVKLGDVVKYKFNYTEDNNLLNVQDNASNRTTSYVTRKVNGDNTLAAIDDTDTEKEEVSLTTEVENNDIIHSYYSGGSYLNETVFGTEKKTSYSSNVFDKEKKDETDELIGYTGDNVDSSTTSWDLSNTERVNYVSSVDIFKREDYNKLYKTDSNNTETVILNKAYSYKDNANSGTVTGYVSKLNYTGPNYNNEIEYSYDANGNIAYSDNHYYQYDNNNQLITDNDAKNSETLSYKYDNNGNITQIKKSGSRIDTEIIGTYVYDSDWGDLLISYNGNAITYDEIGNPLSYYNGNQFAWTMGRQLASTTKSDGTQISYTYNQDGLRTSKPVGSLGQNRRKTCYHCIR